jgi:aspartate/methionine/tyrosine aminotransferase
MEKDAYRLDANELRKIVSEKTGLLVLTNPHLPSGASSDAHELEEVMIVARECSFYVLCDEIYAEFSRNAVPTVFSVDHEWGVVTTSFTKAYGLGGLRAGVALAEKRLIDELYIDKLNTVGPSSNIVEMIIVKLLTEASAGLEKYQQKWLRLKMETEKWLNKKGFKYFPNRVGITYWVKLPIKDTYKWTNEHAIPHFGLAAVPGTFFLFNRGYKLATSSMIRLGLGGVNPEGSHLEESFEVFEKALDTWR